jgi:hypothetical protein
MARLRWHTGRVRQQHKRRGLGDLFGEGVIEHEGVVSALLRRNVVRALGYAVGFAFPNPLDWLETDASEFINHDGRGLAGSRGIFSGFYAIDLSGRRRSGERGGRGGGMQLAGMLEDAKIQRLFMRLDTPRNCVVTLHVNPSYEVGLATTNPVSPFPARTHDQRTLL